MNIDIELYRRQARISIHPRLVLSVIDIAPELPAQTLVFLHGFAGSAVQWQYQLSQFSLENRVIAVDLRGHGQSDKPPGTYSMAEILDDIEMVLYFLGVNQPVVLLGHSYGGAVAAAFAASQPQRVKSLVLIASAVRYRLNPLYRGALRLPEALLRSLDPWVGKSLSAPSPVLKAWYTNNLSSWNGEDIYPKIKSPTLVIRGYYDRLFEKPAYDQVARLIPNAEEIDVGASGHMVMLERKDAVNRAIARFIEAEDPSWSTPELTYEDPALVKMLKERPWLVRYDQQVPYTITVPNVTFSALLQSAASRFPKRKALIFKGSRITYRTLWQDANRFANALCELGLQKGDRVLLALPNIPQAVITYYGTILAGCVAVFAHPGNKPERLIEVIQDSGARVLVTLSEFDEMVRSVQEQSRNVNNLSLDYLVLTQLDDSLPVVKRLIRRLSSRKKQTGFSPATAPGFIQHLRELLNRQTVEAPEIDISPADLAVIMYTGGTTASPKGVMLSHRNLLANTLQTRHWMPDIGEGEELVINVVPMAHIYGLTAAMNVPIALGATILLEPEFKLQDILNDIQHYHPTIFPGVPRIFQAIMNAPGVRKYGLNTIRTSISGSEPLPLEVFESYEKITKSRLIEGYGLTEASPITHANPLNGLQKPGSIGIPLPSTEARLVDLRRGKRTVPPGQIGELAVRGPQVMLGYWKNPEKTAQTITADGWLLTGDVAQMDSDGYFRIIARKDEMWYPGRPDQPASPRAIEEVLHEVPQVKEAAVTAIAGQPVAFVIPSKDRPTAESLIAYCKRRLPPELVPRLVIFVEEFPRSFIGKILRHELTRLLEEHELNQASAIERPEPSPEDQ